MIQAQNSKPGWGDCTGMLAQHKQQQQQQQQKWHNIK